MSERKFSNELSHRSQTLIPRPPYREYPGVLEFRQRFTMQCQLRQVGEIAPLRAWPCVSRNVDARLAAFSR